MFTIAKDPQFTWPVVVQQPAEGGFAEKRFRARFRALPRERQAKLEDTAEGTAQLMREAVVELLDLQDEAGAPVPHSAEVLEALLNIPWVCRGLVRAWVEALAGVPSQAAAGN